MMEPVEFRGYCSDCENETIARDGRCRCGSGRVIRLSDAEARIAELEEEIGRLEDENSDLRCEPWPEWARAVLKVIRKHSGYDGYDDATEGVDMPLELSEHLSEMDAEVGRWKARAEAAEALLKEARDKALEEAVDACAEEYIEDHFAGEEDHAYNRGVADCLAVLRALKEKP